VLYVAPTASGKTKLTARIIHGLWRAGKTVWFVVHRQELLSQVCAALKEEGVSFGVVEAGVPIQAQQRVQVAMVLTLVRRLEELPTPFLTVIDEAHHSCAETWVQLFNHLGKSKRAQK
jgi:superfamily II DNA or RNA helicase